MLPETSLYDEGPPPPCPARFNIARYCLAHWAAETPDRVALTVAETADGPPAERWTCRELERAVLGVAGALRAAGLQPGDRVALRMGNVSAFPLAFFGTIAAGGIAAPTSPMLAGPELDHVLGDMGARFLAVSEGMAPERLPEGVTLLEPGALDGAPGAYADTGAEDPAFLVYTSGATGRPKGVLHAQRSAWARRMMWEDWYGLRPGDLLMHSGAFNWTYTLGTGLTDPWAAGAGTLIWAGPRDAGIWARLAAGHGPQIFAATPGVYRQLLRAEPELAKPFEKLRHGLTAGEAMPPAQAKAWREATGKPLFEALGMSECSTYISAGPGRPAPKGRIGRPQRGRRIAILPEEGETPLPPGEPGLLAISRRDPGLMLGYWRRPEETAASFRGEWFLTGDRAAMDRDGAIAGHGRADEVMNALGYRVGPGEVEAALADHPGIAEIAVAELPVREGVGVIAAFIVPAAEMPAPDDLHAHAAARLAAYKLPREWIELAALPRTATGKVRRRDLIAAHRRDRDPG